jgi:L-fuculose-phosphate aldolase
LTFISSHLGGGPKELSAHQVEQLYEIRRKSGLAGRHPANNL